MVEEINTSNDVYGEGKYNKVIDFLIGTGILLVAYALFNLIFYIRNRISTFWDIPFFNFLSMITIFAAFVVGIRILIQKKFSERKFVKIGFWITFLIPVFILLVLFGACALSWGFGY